MKVYMYICIHVPRYNINVVPCTHTYGHTYIYKHINTYIYTHTDK